MKRAKDIQVRGPWAVAWGLNIAALCGLGLWGWYLRLRFGEPAFLLWGVGGWSVWFVAQEALGFRRYLTRNEAPGPEVATTFSQVMQWVSALDPDSSGVRIFLGFDALVSGMVLLASSTVAHAVWCSLNPFAGAAAGVALAAWLWGHWHNRRRNG